MLLHTTEISSRIPASDHLIFSDVKNGSSEAYSKLYDLYSAPLFGIILKWVKNKEVAIDIFQSSFITIYKKCKTEDYPKFGFLVWMCGIAMSITKNKLQNENVVISDLIHFSAKID